MRIFAGLIAATTLALAAGPALAAEKAIELPPFASVSIASGIDADITVGGAQSIKAQAPESGALDDMKIRVVNGRLEAWFEWSIFDIFRIGGDRGVVRTISVPDLAGAEASSGADVTVTGMTGDALSFEASSGAGIKATGVSGEAIGIEASSGANVSAAGTCVTGTIEVSSGADVDARELLCGDVTVEASSGAHADVYANNSVKAEASSGAGIVVAGTPLLSVESNTSSGGDVEVLK